jgi:hypothetical protein
MGGMPSGSPGARRDPIRSPTRDNFPKDHGPRLEYYKELTRSLQCTNHWRHCELLLLEPLVAFLGGSEG